MSFTSSRPGRYFYVISLTHTQLIPGIVESLPRRAINYSVVLRSDLLSIVTSDRAFSGRGSGNFGCYWLAEEIQPQAQKSACLHVWVSQDWQPRIRQRVWDFSSSHMAHYQWEVSLSKFHQGANLPLPWVCVKIPESGRAEMGQKASVTISKPTALRLS